MTTVSAKLPFPPRYFVASVLLLAALTALFAVSLARRTQEELSRQLEEKGLALADALETSSRNAILGNALMEEMIAQRLLDNARLVDQLLLSRPFDAGWLGEIRAMNRLARDRAARPRRPSVHAAAAPPPPRMMGMMGRPPPRRHGGRSERRAMMMYMWGRRWSPPSARGTRSRPRSATASSGRAAVFGVAVGARSFPGIIAVHADAAYVLDFSREIGVQHQVEELGRQPDIDSIALLDQDLTVVAHSRPERVGQRDADEALREALTSGRTLARVVRREGLDPVYEIVKPLALDTDRPGLLRIALSTASMDRVWRRDRLAAVVLGLVVLALGSPRDGRHLLHAAPPSGGGEDARGGDGAAASGCPRSATWQPRSPTRSAIRSTRSRWGCSASASEFQPAETEEYRALLDVVQGEVRRLNAIVEDFLSLARPLSLRPEPIPVPALVDEVLRLVEGEARAAGIAIERDDPARAAAARGRPGPDQAGAAQPGAQRDPGHARRRDADGRGAAHRAAPLMPRRHRTPGGGIAPEVLRASSSPT